MDIGYEILGCYCLELMTIFGFPVKILLRIRSILVFLSMVDSLLYSGLLWKVPAFILVTLLGDELVVS